MWKEEMELAVDLAIRAGKIAMEIAEGSFQIDRKTDASPVTEADRALNKLIVAGITQRFPEDHIVAEESPNPRPENYERVWFVDPIDGTKDYIQRTGQWSVMIGFAVEGRPVLGVVHQPEKERLYWSIVGQGAFIRQGSDERALTPSTKSDPAYMRVVQSRNHPDPNAEEIQRKLGIPTSYSYGSVGLKAAQIAEGKAHVYMNFSGRCSMWDTAAAEALLLAAGGHLCDTFGEPLSYRGKSARVNAGFIACTDPIHERLVTTLRSRPELDPRNKKA